MQNEEAEKAVSQHLGEKGKHSFDLFSFFFGLMGVFEDHSVGAAPPSVQLNSHCELT